MAPRQGDFERTPPHDVAAEQCVLGGMLLSKDAISDVIEVIRSADHYRPAHQLVHEAILDLYGRGEPADAITVANELSRRGEIARVGGGPYLHTLIASVPTAANAGYYARIVRDRAVLRRLVQAGTRITQMGYGADGEVDSIVDAAEAEIFAVTDKRTSEDYLPLSEITGTLDRDRRIRHTSVPGIPGSMRRLPGHDGPGLSAPRRPPVRRVVPAHHRGRPGRGRAAPRRSARDRALGRGRRRLDG